MMEVGRVCLKIAGRDAGETAVIIGLLDNGYVLVDGNVRRRKCNVRHLEPLGQTLEVKENAPTKEVLEAMKRAKIEVKKKEKIEKKEKAEKKETSEKPKKEKKPAEKAKNE